MVQAWRVCGTALLLFIASAMAGKGLDSPEGRWKTMDDKTGRAKAIVEIKEADGLLRGRIIHLYPYPGEDTNRVCVACHGEKKDRPIRGMEILWGLSRKGDAWEGGSILDPKSGKVYRCRLEPIDGGRRLEVRGYLGISLLGRTQTWERLDSEGMED